MIDKEKLRYDLAMNAAVVMTLRDVGNRMGTAPGLMLNNFLNAYRQYSEPFSKQLDEVVEKINKSE